MMHDSTVSFVLNHYERIDNIYLIQKLNESFDPHTPMVLCFISGGLDVDKNNNK